MPTSFAPGRVNLIGEHIDYHGLPVLPMALRRGVRLGFRRREDGEVRLGNGDGAFDPRRFALRPDLTPGPPGDWGNYAMAAAVTVAARYGAEVGIEGDVSSDLPVAAGLSSSSALVVAVALALLHAAEIEVDRMELAQALADGERFVGTAGGGMDQAASLNGCEGHALRIGFDPLSVSPVRLPQGWTVVVAHTGVSAEKSGGAQEAYNERRRESGMALNRLASEMGAEGASPAVLLEHFEGGALLGRLGASVRQGDRWAAHTVAEAGRVEEAVLAVEGGDIATFGDLLNRSHASLRDVYQVSHPRLDRLVTAALEAGAAGARLTGAGFGGCMLAVCSSEASRSVVAGLREAQKAMDPPPALHPFIAEPGEGARIEAR